MNELVVAVPERLPAALRARIEAAATAGGRRAVLRAYADREGLRAALASAEVLLGAPRPGECAAAPGLRWVHVTSAGVDRLPLAELGAAGIRLTNARGQHADAMADHAVALLLALSRGLPAFVLDQQARRWQPRGGSVLAGRRLGVLGLGAIGHAVARRATAFGMEVWATRRHPAPDPTVAQVLGPGREDLLRLCAACDDLVAVLPSTAETRGLLDAEALGALPRGARLINLGRGDVLDERALESALRSGHLGGAACDCLPREPLPPDATLWTAPGLLITPHVGGSHPDYEERATAAFAANLTRYCRGEALENLVDLQAGY